MLSAEYEQAKLTLQKVEARTRSKMNGTSPSKIRICMNLLTVERRFQSHCGTVHRLVILVESSKVLGREIIISAQIDDIFVSIKEQEGYGTSGAIIARTL